MDPFTFQEEKAHEIAEKFSAYLDDPPTKGKKPNKRVIPFYQSLGSITGSGKTLILAEAVSGMALRLPLKPLVIWLSMGRVVVEQSYMNLLPSGKYTDNVSGFRVKLLAEYESDDAKDLSHAYLYFATVGTFNAKDKEKSDRLIFRSDTDTLEDSIWNALKRRDDDEGRRRPLIVVYDEAQNLTDQQVTLLLELEPTAILVSSATVKLPPLIQELIQDLQTRGDFTLDDLTTTVPTKEVVDANLVKMTVTTGGYQTPMEEAIDDLLADMVVAEKAAIGHQLTPKAIYVCKTNIVDGNALKRDDSKRPFTQREAPPILIWRYLVEQKGVPPDQIAVYCTVDFDPAYPAPQEFVHFRGGEKDYATFTTGPFRHIIFNKSLQEGWDDPECYFAYIDKSMGSEIAVEQIIGRILRQPKAKRYPADILNTAHLYVRVDAKGVFQEVANRINGKLAKDMPEVEFRTFTKGKNKKPLVLQPRKTKTVPRVVRDTTDALPAVTQIVEDLIDIRALGENDRRGQGGRAKVQQVVGQGTEATFEWTETDHSNVVLARWVFQRGILRRFAPAIDVTAHDDPKFDARIELGSKAFNLVDAAAENVVMTFLKLVRLKPTVNNPYEVGSITVNADKLIPYRNAIHESYSDLNTNEAAVAELLDKTGRVWSRNPVSGGWCIPLLSLGKTKDFYPDFLVWRDKDVIALETSGEHLVKEKLERKLLSIEPAKNGQRVLVVIGSQGKWNDAGELIQSTGWTSWRLRNDGQTIAVHHKGTTEFVQHALAATAE